MRVAREALAGAFLKVEASKFTEVGYVGRDVESMVRDLVETGIAMVRAEHQERVRARPARRRRRLADTAEARGKPPNGMGREDVLRRLRADDLDDTLVEVRIPDRRTPTIEVRPARR